MALVKSSGSQMWTDLFARVTANSGLNQIRGTTVNGSTGTGIPKHVTNVSSLMSNAQVGSTSTITVTFQRDPTDAAFAGVTVWAKGYQSNPSPVQVAQSTQSPITFVLTNTGEAVSLIVQSQGNGGSAPLSTAPTAGISLPKSTGGGVGTTTVVSPPAVSGSATAGQLAKFASPATTVTGGNLSGDVTTVGTTAATVAGIQSKSVSSTAPVDQQILKYVASGSSYRASNLFQPTVVIGQNFATAAMSKLMDTVGFSTAGVGLTGTTSSVTGSATVPRLPSFTTSTTASTSSGFSTSSGNLSNQYFRSWDFLYTKLIQTTACRMWLGLSIGSSTDANFRSDTPNVNFIGFRFSTAAGDTNWTCIVQTNNVNTTLADSGVAVDTSNHKFSLRWDDTNYTFFIDDVQVASISTNVPSMAADGSGGVAVMGRIDNVGLTNAKGFSCWGVVGIAKGV